MVQNDFYPRKFAGFRCPPWRHGVSSAPRPYWPWTWLLLLDRCWLHPEDGKFLLWGTPSFDHSKEKRGVTCWPMLFIGMICCVKSYDLIFALHPKNLEVRSSDAKAVSWSSNCGNWSSTMVAFQGTGQGTPSCAITLLVLRRNGMILWIIPIKPQFKGYQQS